MSTGSGLRITRWRRFGHDRLYVNDTNGARLGWFDLSTGTETIEDAQRADEFRAALMAFDPTLRPGSPQPGSTPEARDTTSTSTDTERPPSATTGPISNTEAPEPPAEYGTLTDGPAGWSPLDTSAVPATAGAQPPTRPVTPEPEWEDLALRIPGQAARERALEELADAKQRAPIRTFLARAFDARTDERAWRIGADGEETVGGRLEKLTRHGWFVLHAVPIGDRGSDIDHVLIGPGGVFTINTKNHPGAKIWVASNAIRVNGHAVPYLRNSRHEATRAAKLLSGAIGFNVPVRPALVLLTGTLIPQVTIKQAPDDVTILDRMDVPRVFRRAHRQLTDHQVATVYDHARRSTTWVTARR